jgi:ribosomal protein L37AE/L43A
MTVHRCPRCRRHSLVHTGAFWACEVCRYAITQVALSFEHGVRQADERCFTSEKQTETRVLTGRE